MALLNLHRVQVAATLIQFLYQFQVSSQNVEKKNPFIQIIATTVLLLVRWISAFFSFLYIWDNNIAVNPQGSVHGLLFYLIYINYLSCLIQYICKIFPDGTSLFSKYQDSKNPQQELNKGLTIIKRWTFQWKMNFNPDLTNKLSMYFFLAKP